MNVSSLSLKFFKVSYGASIGWVSPALKLLISKDTPLPSGPITVEGLSSLESN